MTRTDSVSVPFLDLGPSHQALKDDVLDDVARLIDSNAFTNGPAVAQFEEAFAEYCAARDCIGLASGLDALRLALLASDIGPGDEVIVPASTFIATFEAVTQAGATPIPVEIDARDYTWTICDRECDHPRTRAIIPVHLYGQVADMIRLREVSTAASLVLVEDACQAHGAGRDGIRSGSGGHAAAFSFYPGKNLGAFGDAGALVTNDPSLAGRIRALREHGQRRKYEPRSDRVYGSARHHPGARAPAQASAPERLESCSAGSRPRYYRETLSGVGDLVLPHVPDGSEPVWHLYVVRSEASDGLLDGAPRAGDRRRAPLPASRSHLSPAYERLGIGADRSRSPNSSPRRCCPCRCSRVSPRRSSRAVAQRGALVLRRWPTSPANDAPYRLIADVEFGEGVLVYSFANLYGCSIGDGTRIGPFVEIQRGASDRRALQDPEPHVRLRRRRRSPMRCSSGTA